MAAAALVAAALACPAPAAQAHKADPNYLTEVKTVEPGDGISVTVFNRGDQLQLHNTSGEDVVVEGYDGEPYARVMADGTVQVNTNSPAHYLNEDRFGTTEPPAGVTAESPPEWEKLSRTGRFEWHDHRAHWMGKSRPPAVKDPDVRTKVYDWEVPLRVGGEAGRIAGTLFWTPKPGGDAPVAAIAAGTAIVVALSVMVFVVRRRRRAGAGEAW